MRSRIKVSQLKKNLQLSKEQANIFYCKKGGGRLSRGGGIGSSPGDKIGGGAGKLNVLWDRDRWPSVPPPPRRLGFISSLLGGVGRSDTLPPTRCCRNIITVVAESLTAVKGRVVVAMMMLLLLLTPGCRDVATEWNGNAIAGPPPMRPLLLTGDSSGGESGRKTEE